MRKSGARTVMAAAGLAALMALAACGKGGGEAEKAPAAGDAAAPGADAGNGGTAPSASIKGLPRPKTGNWKMTTSMAGMTLPATTVCFTQEMVSSETWAQGMKQDAGITCSEQRTRMDGNAVVTHSVCEHDGRTTTADIRAEGDFNSRYTTTMTTSTTPLPPGMTNPTVMTVTAERVGDC